MEDYLNEIHAAAEFIQAQDSRKPKIAIILGSGLGKLADTIKNPKVIPYSHIPGFPISTAIGHKGNLIIGELGGKVVMAMQGRFHYYEGYSMRQVTLPIRVMSVMGIEYLFVSNAAGGLNEFFKVGDLMVICDHINMAPSPLIGKNLDDFGPRFPDMSQCYNRDLIHLAEKTAAGLDIKLRRGVYVVVTGPNYETPSECRCYHNMGGDAIGMSTVPEVIVARHCSMKVLGVSVITDEAHFFRDDNFVIDEEDVVKAADAAADEMTLLFERIIEKMEI